MAANARCCCLNESRSHPVIKRPGGIGEVGVCGNEFLDFPEYELIREEGLNVTLDDFQPLYEPVSTLTFSHRSPESIAADLMC